MEILAIIFKDYINVNFAVGFFLGWLLFYRLNLKKQALVDSEIKMRKEECENLKKMLESLRKSGDELLNSQRKRYEDEIKRLDGKIAFYEAKEGTNILKV
ncbi:hypothetical protein NYG92_08995 [Campylobacter felis]|uniref:hypothetical protein n=1 Tax=Campylobacter felis TaxID=2974565 RepID=UPI0025620FFB|nr:hypothetical protein [Campylobacter felis]MDL0110874.1 hypothetical protein [Campylobacter felis]